MLEYFVARTDASILRIEEKIDKLYGFRFMIIGGSILASTVISALLSVALIWVEYKN